MTEAEQLIREFTTDDLIECYRRGIFPMSESADDPGIFFVDPKLRGIIPLDGLHISKSLRKVLRSHTYEITFDTEFDAVVDACALPRAQDSETWINAPIKYLYSMLHARGYAHSVEVWQDGSLVGGLYGVSVGAAFFGESMFSRADNASKVGLVHLVERLNERGYLLLDTQFLTPHLATLGGIEITRDEYHRRLSAALKKQTSFHVQNNEKT